jgi:hypothetical protein
MPGELGLSHSRPLLAPSLHCEVGLPGPLTNNPQSITGPSTNNPQSITGPSALTFSVTPATVISTIVNVVYAMHYPVKGAHSSLSTPAEAGISLASAFAAFTAASALFYFLWRRRRRARAWYSGRGRSPQSNDSASSVPTP